MPETRHCNYCGLMRPLHEFRVIKGRYIGNQCLACRREYYRQWSAKSRAKINARKRKWRYNNREQINAWRKRNSMTKALEKVGM